MKVIIQHASKLETSVDEYTLKSIGTLYSQDRYYTLLNGSIDENLSKKSKLLAFMTDYLFQSGNYKHKSSIANGKTKGMWVVDILCWISIVGFIACFFGGVAAPIFKAIKVVGGKPTFEFTEFVKGFQGAGAILLSISLVFLIITIAYLIVIFKIKKKNQKLALKDYVLKKLEFVLKFKVMLKASSLLGTSKKTEELLVLGKCDVLNDTDRWLFLQVTNLAFMLFGDFNLTLQFDDLDEAYYNSAKQMIENDFKNLAIINMGVIKIK